MNEHAETMNELVGLRNWYLEVAATAAYRLEFAEAARFERYADEITNEINNRKDK